MREQIQPLPPTTPTKSRSKGILFGTCLGIIILVVLAIGYGVSQLGNVFSPEDSGTITEVVLRGEGSDKIALIRVHGVIVQAGSADTAPGTISAETMKSMLEKAGEDPTVKAVILDIDSPGGSVVPSVQIYEALANLRQTKPIVAFYSGEVAASGAVYLSMGASKIISYPETITGSIGVIAEFYDLSGLMEKYGVTSNVIKSGAFKDIGSPTRPMNDAERNLLQGLIDETYQEFVSVVATNRHLSEDVVRSFADGRVFSGRQAEALQLIDDLGNVDRAETLAKELAGITEAQIVEYEQPLSFGSLFSYFGTTFREPNIFELIDRRRSQPSLQLLYLMQ